ncbi:hypothetical protein P171DRAFT_435304 [Karstenula rhodostoma CBS 690.94]|uniref:DUF7788 domain-containing protein n=1 Tax=Karstenula rhodostoma CBS 690.94 TaxID=1392251 RepID=A0A9P4PAJ6_9PLEO|nr:hypothetical protein P171DRAFT_435304 [Karstenula rhodostoma CBS 690.94]
MVIHSGHEQGVISEAFDVTGAEEAVPANETVVRDETYVSGGEPRARRGMSTNSTAVFKDVIWPMAAANNPTQEDMVKQVSVLSNMQFDAAQHCSEHWTSSYCRIQRKYAKAGYQMPKLVFWNLAERALTTL